MWFPLKKYTVATIAEIEIFLSQRCLSLLSLPSLLSLNSVFPYIAKRRWNTFFDDSSDSSDGSDYMEWETFFVFPLVWMECLDKLVWPLDHLIRACLTGRDTWGHSTALKSVKGNWKLTSSLMGHGKSEQRSFCGKWYWESKTFTVLQKTSQRHR